MQKNTQKESKKSKAPKKVKGESAPKSLQASKLFSLRNKIFVSFLIPIVFMIAVGFISYSYASEGMNENFRDSSQQTANLTIQYLDTSATYI